MNKVAKALNELERETNIKRATTKEKKSRNNPPPSPYVANERSM